MGNKNSKDQCSNNELDQPSKLLNEENQRLFIENKRLKKGLKKIINELYPIYKPSQDEITFFDQIQQNVIKSSENVCLMFVDIIGSTNLSKEMHPLEVVKMLSYWYNLVANQQIKSKFKKLTFVEYVGDCIVIESGARVENSQGVIDMVQLAFEILNLVPLMKQRYLNFKGVRIGIHQQEAYSGIIMAPQPRWRIYGNVINQTARLEQTCPSNQIQISQVCYDYVIKNKDLSKLNWIEAEVEMKGLGKQKTYRTKISLTRRSSIAPLDSPRTLIVSQPDNQEIGQQLKRRFRNENCFLDIKTPEELKTHKSSSIDHILFLSGDIKPTIDLTNQKRTPKIITVRSGELSPNTEKRFRKQNVKTIKLDEKGVGELKQVITKLSC